MPMPQPDTGLPYPAHAARSHRITTPDHDLLSAPFPVINHHSLMAFCIICLSRLEEGCRFRSLTLVYHIQHMQPGAIGLQPPTMIS